MARFRIKIGGESGQGINSVGEILAHSIKNIGYKVFAYREYPSLIKGGWASYQIDLSDQPLYSSSKKCDLLVCSSRVSVHKYLSDLDFGGLLIHTLPEMTFSRSEKQFINESGINVIYINAEQQSLLAGGSKLTANVVLVGVVSKILDLDYKVVESIVLKTFGRKKEYIEINKSCLRAGYQLEGLSNYLLKLSFEPDKKWKSSLLIDGNKAIGLGALSAGVRFYVAYPMTPSTSILEFISASKEQSGVVIKQAEDEITAAQMAIGAMFAGTRAMTATSGGGFDLMTESLSLAGITETPFVCVIAQRPGPATGLPTWTAAGDLNLAVFAGHGEFPRAVVAISDPQSAYLRVQEAFNIAEVYQIPVLILTEKQIAESWYNIDKLGKQVKVVRGLVDDPAVLEKLKPTDRYEYSASGVSKRWLPGSSHATYNGNSDEHNREGDSIEDASTTVLMMQKRMRKLESLSKVIPEPHLLGSPRAKKTIVGWGSVKNSVLDFLNSLDGRGYNYLHYEYIWPLKTETLMKLVERGNEMILIESNFQGQLGKLIKMETGYEIKRKLLKYDGRPFFIEDILDFVKGSANEL